MEERGLSEHKQRPIEHLLRLPQAWARHVTLSHFILMAALAGGPILQRRTLCLREDTYLPIPFNPRERKEKRTMGMGSREHTQKMLQRQKQNKLSSNVEPCRSPGPTTQNWAHTPH